MPARQCAETVEGLALMAKGVSVRKAARLVGVSPSTLTRAKARRAKAKKGKK
jgi:transposase